jgi:hypothetical protein
MPTQFARALRVLVAAGPLALAACDGESMASDDGDEADAQPRGCASELRADTYALGLRKVGGAFTVQFADALPAPPTRGDNTWTVMVMDANGAGMTDLSLAAVPFMPDHMHGTTVETVVTPGPIPGEYVLDPVNLFMPGLWEVTLEMTAQDGTEDDVVFSFCVDP